MRKEILQVQSPDFTGAETEQLRLVLVNNIHISMNLSNELGLCTHAIELVGERPLRMQPYCTSKTNRRFIRQETEDWMKKGIIRRSKSAYASLVIVIDQPHHKSTPKGCVSSTIPKCKDCKTSVPHAKSRRPHPQGGGITNLVED